MTNGFAPLALLLFDQKAISRQFAFKIEWSGGSGYILHRTSFYTCFVKLEFSEIGTEIKCSARNHGLKAVIDQLHMIPLYIKDIFHSLAITKSRWVHYNKVEITDR